jgi:hypothetical protein
MNEYMEELMLHMIGYSNLESIFTNVVNENAFPLEMVIELAKKCDDQWGTEIVKMIGELK